MLFDKNAFEVFFTKFGTMDANDAKIISQNIDNIYNLSSNGVLLIKKETALVKNVISQLDHYQITQNENIREFVNLTTKLDSLTAANRINNIMLENILITKNNLDYLNSITQAIENSIQADHTSLISPLLIKPHNLINSLKEIQLSNSANTMFTLKISNYHLFIRLSLIETFMYKNKFIY